MTEWVLILIFITGDGVTSQSINIPGENGVNHNCAEALSQFLDDNKSKSGVTIKGYCLQR